MKMDLKLAVLVPIFLSSVCGNIIINSPAITDYGIWGSWDRCPFGKYAQGFQVRTEPYQGLSEDDTAVNAIRLFCGDPSNSSTVTISSTENSWGNWGSSFSCRSDGRPLPPDGYITGFQLRVEGPQGALDDTATNNFKAICTYPNGSEQQIEGDGLTYGSWSAIQRCNSNQAICAFQTQVEGYQGDSDDTSLNNIAAECCDR